MIRPQSSKSFSSLVLRPSHNRFHSLYWWINFINIFWYAKSAAFIHKSGGHPSVNPLQDKVIRCKAWHWISPGDTRWILTQRTSFQQWFMASIFNQNLAVLHYFLICALLLTRHQESTFKQHQGGASNGRFNPIPGHENREGRRRNLRFTADLYSDPLPDRQDQVRCGWASLAREYEQLGEIFQRGRPRPGRARWSCGRYPPGRREVKKHGTPQRFLRYSWTGRRDTLFLLYIYKRTLPNRSTLLSLAFYWRWIWA